MTDFITRVELHGAGPADYPKLYAQMAAFGFRTKIASEDGNDLAHSP